jgi:transcription elongation GreA/GreB family factor
MPQKINLLEQLEAEKKHFEIHRDQILSDIDNERVESNEEDNNAIIEDLLVKLKTVVDQLFKLENTIYELRIAKSKKDGKIGQSIHVGDCVTLESKTNHKQYYITNDSYYVNPELGIISSNSPIAQKLLSKKFGEVLEMTLNGTPTRYQLIP